MTSPQDRSWSFSSLLSSTLPYDLDVVDISAISGQRRSDPCLWRKLNSTQSEFHAFHIWFSSYQKKNMTRIAKAALRFLAVSAHCAQVGHSTPYKIYIEKMSWRRLL